VILWAQTWTPAAWKCSIYHPPRRSTCQTTLNKVCLRSCEYCSIEPTLSKHNRSTHKWSTHRLRSSVLLLISIECPNIGRTFPRNITMLFGLSPNVVSICIQHCTPSSMQSLLRVRSASTRRRSQRTLKPFAETQWTRLRANTHGPPVMSVRSNSLHIALERLWTTWCSIQTAVGTGELCIVKQQIWQESDSTCSLSGMMGINPSATTRCTYLETPWRTSKSLKCMLMRPVRLQRLQHSKRKNQPSTTTVCTPHWMNVPRSTDSFIRQGMNRLPSPKVPVLMLLPHLLLQQHQPSTNALTVLRRLCAAASCSCTCRCTPRRRRLSVASATPSLRRSKD
jgi:hypothetical protein